jgi:23S rRNA G2445 N2-methylase RlmL
MQVPTVIYHGSRDEIVPLVMVRPLAEQVFMNLYFHVVDDDHGLYKTVHELDWQALVAV